MTPRNFWTVGLGWYAACMALTFWLKGLKGATTVVALAGVPWAITCWVRALSLSFFSGVGGVVATAGV